MNPKPDEILKARKRVGWTQAQAAAACLVTVRAWQNWEAGTRKMPPGYWELFRLRAAAKANDDIALWMASRDV